MHEIPFLLDNIFIKIIQYKGILQQINMLKIQKAMNIYIIYHTNRYVCVKIVLKLSN
jgi:hypothetical protein